MPALTQDLGDSVTHRIPLRWGGRPFVPGDDWSLVFTVKADADTADSARLLSKGYPAQGIEVSGSTASVTILRADTFRELDYPDPGDPAFEATAGDYVWDIQANETAGDYRTRTVASGTLTLTRDVTRLSEVTAPVYVVEDPMTLVVGADGPTGPTGPEGPTGPTGPEGINVVSATTPPSSPADGDLWYDTEDGSLSVWNEAQDAWVETSGATDLTTALELTTLLQGAEADPTRIGVEYMPDAIEVGSITLADPEGAVLDDGVLSGGPDRLIYQHNGVDAGGIAYRPEPENVVRYIKEITAVMKNRQPLRSVVVGTVISGTYVVSTFTASSVNSGSAVVTNVTVAVGDTASQVAAKIAAAIAANATINTAYSATSIGPFLFFQCLSATVDATLTHATGVGDTSGMTASSVGVKTSCMTLLGSFDLPSSYVTNASKFMWEGDSFHYHPEET